MPKIIPALCFAGSMSFFYSAPAFAQSDTDGVVAGSKWGLAAESPFKAPISADSSYESRALRIESYWGNYRIVRGAEGPIVGKAGVFRATNIEKLVAGSARAESEARLFRADHRPGAIATAIGGVTFVVGLFASSSNSNSAATPILMIGGVGTMLWGAKRLNAAYSSLSRAIWWYNRDLTR